MHRLSRRLLRPFRRSKKTHPENEQGSPVATEISGDPHFVHIQTDRERYGLFKLVTTPFDDEFSIDIVAVHGLGGDWESTWTDPESNKLWLRDFIPSQFPNTTLRIWSFGYDSATAFTNSVADIDDAAKALVNALHGERQEKNARKKPIIFIAHSLGGIIVKRAMNLAIERSELWKDIVDSVFSIIFFAVPHCGADSAKLATVAANVCRFATFGFAVNKNFVEALNRNSPEFRQISSAFIQPASKLQIIRTFYETNKMANKLIVDRGSAILGLNNEHAIPIQGANHSNICKFSSNESQKYKSVGNAMRHIIGAAMAPENEDTEDAFLDALSFPGMLEGLGYKHESEHPPWLFHNNTFQDWLRNREGSCRSRLLWITGMPGSGKSSAIRDAHYRLLEEQDVIEGAHYVAAFFFKKSNEGILRSPDEMYRGLLHQVLIRQRQMFSVVTRRALDGGSKKPSHHQHSEREHRALLSDVLRGICNSFKRTTIFIDAVDECVDGDRFGWETFLNTIVESDDFKSLRICLSSRHFGASSWLLLPPPNPIEPMDPVTPVVEVEMENHGAIRTYLDNKLSFYSRDTEVLALLKDEILVKSSGVFIWVVTFVDRLIEDVRGPDPRTGALALRLHPTPDPLKKLYESTLRTAKDPTKTWRFFQWLLMAPDLSLRAWRDLIPFFRDKPPRSLKLSRMSKDWAHGSMDSDQEDSWILDLQRIVCRISLGLAHVAMVSETNLKVPAGDRHSIAGEAGSWNTADGDKWIVRPINETLRLFLWKEGGFAMLKPEIKDHYGEGLTMAMNTCLDFVKAREFSRRGVVLNTRKNIPVSEYSTASLQSDGDASAQTSISYFSSARSVSYEGNMTMSSKGSLSTEEMDLDDDGIQMGAVLAQLNHDANLHPESSQGKRERIESWRGSVAGDGDSASCLSLSTVPSHRSSARSLRWENWSSELLSYILTAFPKFAQSAEKAGVNSSPVIIRFCEGRLWKLWLYLSDEMAANTTLKQWAESQRLHTWVDYLARIGTSSALRRNHDVHLNYCSDGGDHFVRKSGQLDLSRPALAASGSRLTTAKDLSNALFGQLVETNWPGETTRFIPYRSLRGILTETVVAELLRRETKLTPKKAWEIREFYLKVLGILILINRVSYIKMFFKAKIKDECLPLKTRIAGSRYDESDIVAQILKHERSIPEGVDDPEEVLFGHYQWFFLSPFLAKKPSGQLQHYKIKTPRHPLPIIERDEAWGTHGIGGNGRDLQEKVRFHPESFHFQEYGTLYQIQKESPEYPKWFIIKSLRGVSWQRFLSIVIACRFVCEHDSEDPEPGVLPILCTLEHPSPADSYDIDYHLIFPLPRGDLTHLCEVDPSEQKWAEQLTERWLISQCSRMAATLSAIHQVAALKLPGLPRFLFLRSARLSANMVYRMSPSETQLGTLVLGNLCQDPPGAHESAPEYSMSKDKWRKPATERSNNEISSITRVSGEIGEIEEKSLDQHVSKIEDLEKLDGVDHVVTMRHSHPSLGARSLSSGHSASEIPSFIQVPKRRRLVARTRRRKQPAKVTASKFHVWCLATIWLQLITWFILGHEGISSSELASLFDPSSAENSTSGFFEEVQIHPVDADSPSKSYKLKRIVVELIDRLQRQESCTISIKRILNFIRDRMLVIDPALRATTQEVMETLGKIYWEVAELRKTKPTSAAS